VTHDINNKERKKILRTHRKFKKLQVISFILMEASGLACYVSSSAVPFLEAITEESERPSLDRGVGVRWPDRHAVCVSQELETSRTIVAILLHHVLGTTACDVQYDDRGICVVSWTHSHNRWHERKTQRDKDTGLDKKEIN